MLTKLLLAAVGILTLIGVARGDSCTPSDFCKDKVAGIAQVYASTCVETYVGAINANDAQAAAADAKARFWDCTHELSNEWKIGFGRRCGGPVAQDACFQACNAHGITERCLEGCARF